MSRFDIDWEPLAWAIGFVGVAASISFGAAYANSNHDKYAAQKYQACVQYHSPKECSDE